MPPVTPETESQVSETGKKRMAGLTETFYGICLSPVHPYVSRKASTRQTEDDGPKAEVDNCWLGDQVSVV